MIKFQRCLIIFLISSTLLNIVVAEAQVEISPTAGQGDAYHPSGKNGMYVADDEPAPRMVYPEARPVFLFPETQAPQPAQQPAPPARAEIVPRLTVRGDAELQKPADQLVLRLGVVSQSNESAQAMEQNTHAMQDVIAAIEKTGVKKKEFQTGRFQVRPTYAHRPRQPEPNWKPTITGYEVTNTIEIKTQQLELAGPLIEAATKAGANTVENIVFDLADKRKHRSEAIAAAAANAMADAQTLATASGQKLLRVISINVDNAAINPPVLDRTATRGMGAADAAEPPPIAPGDVTVRASVTIVYEIVTMN